MASQKSIYNKKNEIASNVLLKKKERWCSNEVFSAEEDLGKSTLA